MEIFTKTMSIEDLFTEAGINLNSMNTSNKNGVVTYSYYTVFNAMRYYRNIALEEYKRNSGLNVGIFKLGDLQSKKKEKECKYYFFELSKLNMNNRSISFDLKDMPQKYTYDGINEFEQEIVILDEEDDENLKSSIRDSVKIEEEIFGKIVDEKYKKYTLENKIEENEYGEEIETDKKVFKVYYDKEYINTFAKYLINYYNKNKTCLKKETLRNLQDRLWKLFSLQTSCLAYLVDPSVKQDDVMDPPYIIKHKK